MALKFWIRMIWIGCIGMILLIGGNIFFIFFLANFDSSQDKELELILENILPDPKEKTSVKGLEYYKAIWETKVHVDIPTPISKPTISPPPTKPKFQEIVEKYITIKNIFTDSRAFVTIGNEDIVIGPEPKDPSRVKGGNWKWSFPVAGQTVIVVKLVPQQGIEFCSSDRTQKAWLPIQGSKNPSSKNPPSKMPPEKSRVPESRPSMEENSQTFIPGVNSFVMDEEEEEDIIKNYDQYVQDLGPETNPDFPGVKLRGTNPKALKYGLQKDDVITMINGVSVRSEADIRNVMEKQSDNQIVLTLRRKSANQWTTVQLKFESKNGK